MNEKNVPSMAKKANEGLPQAMQSMVKKPYHEPVLTRHELLLENTHFEFEGVTGGLG